MIVELTTRAVGPERYELTVTATPTTAVDRLEIAGSGKGSFGPTARGQQRVVTTIVEARGEIWASARVPVDGVEMVKTATITLGAPRPVAKTKLYATPDGELAREVRR